MSAHEQATSSSPGETSGSGTSGEGHLPAPQPFERHADLVVLGGSAAGFGAALRVVRAGRSVIVVDARGSSGRGHDDAVAAARSELRRHGGEVLDGAVTSASPAEDGGGARVVRVVRDDGVVLLARHVLVATALDALEADGGLEAVTTRLADDALHALQEADRVVGPTLAGGQREWDHRYRGEQVWSGNPNGSLVVEAEGMTPGRALDVGAGEGGDALWLAAQGWRVTASDISQRGLDHIGARAAERGLTVDLLHADANGDEPFPGGAFDLVSAQYASIPRTPDDRAVHNLLSAVAAGGTLLVIGHDLSMLDDGHGDDGRDDSDANGGHRDHADDGDGGHGADGHCHGHGDHHGGTETRPMFDHHAYVEVAAFAAAIADDPDWVIEEHGVRPRPPGAVSGHHVSDVVLRARRLTPSS